ncbi:sensor histidine kinase [Mumia sp. DW29H23]|uniref:sensor histidine kinase n=1 Tax=Mumia sp. DW29H23 TaxID=3421241 RepID=UPI003D69E7D6
MRTVRGRITVLSTGVSAVVLAIAAAALVATLDAQLANQGDGAARARATELARAAAAGDAPDGTAGAATVIEPATDDGFVQVVASSGEVLAASSNLAPGRAVAAPAREPHDLAVATLTAQDDGEPERYRVWSTAVEDTDGDVVTVLVGTSLEVVGEATRTLRTALYLGVPLMLALVAAGTWLVVGRALARVEQVRRELDDIGGADLSRRLELGSPDEVGRLVETLNGLLERLARARHEQQDFVADASHELQSPLTALRTQLEVAQAHPERVDEDALVANLLEDTGRMEVLVRDLLVLAAGEAPSTGRSLVAVADVVTEALAVVDLAGRLVAVERRDEPDLYVTARTDDLVRVVRNLVENAVHHARTAVLIEAGVAGPDVVVRVVDDGPGVPPGVGDAVFNRFYRADPARAVTSRGTGLGLAIARTLARRHGGDVRLEDGSDGGAVFALRLPRAAPGVRAPQA